jgi:hypothetical protein
MTTHERISRKMDCTLHKNKFELLSKRLRSFSFSLLKQSYSTTMSNKRIKLSADDDSKETKTLQPGREVEQLGDFLDSARSLDCSRNCIKTRTMYPDLEYLFSFLGGEHPWTLEQLRSRCTQFNDMYFRYDLLDRSNNITFWDTPDRKQPGAILDFMPFYLQIQSNSLTLWFSERAAKIVFTPFPKNVVGFLEYKFSQEALQKMHYDPLSADFWNSWWIRGRLDLDHKIHDELVETVDRQLSGDSIYHYSDLAKLIVSYLVHFGSMIHIIDNPRKS